MQLFEPCCRISLRHTKQVLARLISKDPILLLRGIEQHLRVLDKKVASQTFPSLPVWSEPNLMCRLSGTTWGQAGTFAATQGARDVVSVMALCRVPRTVTVAIAGRWTTFDTRPNVLISYFEMPFDSKISGAVTIAMNGMTTEGPPILNEWTEDEVSSTSRLSLACFSRV